MAPVAAANKALFSVFIKRSCKGRRPKYFLTRSRISLSSAHLKRKQYSFYQFKNILFYINLKNSTSTMFL
jgi:hypothetical protein